MLGRGHEHVGKTTGDMRADGGRSFGNRRPALVDDGPIFSAHGKMRSMQIDVPASSAQFQDFSLRDHCLATGDHFKLKANCIGSVDGLK